MIIKQTTTDLRSYDGRFPDLFVSDKEKRSKKYIKSTLDFFLDGVALPQYKRNLETFCENYRFLKGDLRAADFYEDEDIRGFYEDLTDDMPLAKYVQQYSILNMPINSLWGEYMGKPENPIVKAFDADSKSEELQYMTDLMMDYTQKLIQSRIYQKASMNGMDLADPEVQAQLELELQRQVQEGMTTFSTQGEKWANRILSGLKADFNVKEHAGQTYRDLLITGRPRVHIYEENSATGFGFENVNPKNVWYYMDKNERYLKNAIYAGLVEVKDITDIMKRVKLTEEEIDQLREESKDMYLTPNHYESNLFNNKTGQESITYNAGVPEPYRTQEQMYMESALMREMPGDELLMSLDGSSVMGQKHVVLTAYWQAKKKIGSLTYIDDMGEEQTSFVNDTYISGTHPGEIDLEWTYDNQWWKGMKIGQCVYIAEPLEILDYCPILGIDFDNRNSKIASMVDLMKPYQMIFNLCMNQLWELLNKEAGVVLEYNARHIPADKDISMEDAIEAWLAKKKELGIIFSDDSLENMQVPSSTNTNVSKRHDLSRHQEMQSRLAIAQQIKVECHALVGFNPERLGGIAATQTATGTNAALASSYSQTRIWEEAQQELMTQGYQAIIDVAQFFESNKEASTISYMNDEGDRAFFEVMGSDLKFRDFRCLVTSQNDDLRKLESVRALAQPFLQNGADFYTVSKMLISDSIRDIQAEFKKSKERREAQEAQASQLQQQQIEQQSQSAQAALEQQAQIEEAKMVNDNNNKQLDRISKERVALLNAAGRDKTVLDDADGSGVADALEATTMENEIMMAQRQHSLEEARMANDSMIKQQKNANDRKKTSQDFDLKSRELDIREKEIQQRAEAEKNKLKIARTNKN